MFKRNKSIPEELKLNKKDYEQTGLYEISNCGKSDRSADVIFVHGLMGHPITTWHQDEQCNKDCWLYWLGNEADCSEVGIWSFGYQAEFSKWKGSSMPLPFRANSFLDILESNNIGKRPIIFITHSLGGLLVKDMLRTADTYRRDPKKQAIFAQTKGIVFLGTPHTGSDMAKWVDQLIRALGLLGSAIARQTPSSGELRSHDPYLLQLNDWYREFVSNLQILTKFYRHIQPVKGIFEVVDPASANPGISGVSPVDVDADHISIAKPKTPKDQPVYRSVKTFIQDCLSTPLQLPLSHLEQVKKEEWDRIANPQ